MQRPPLELSYTGHLSDRVDDLNSGNVMPEGINLRFIRHQPAQAFRRVLAGEFDTGEMSLATHIVRVSRGDDDLVAIPVFPSRAFRHRAFYVCADSGVTHPSHLAGRRVGVPEYQMTAALWARGLLQHEYGVAPSEISWVTGGLRQPGRRPLIEMEVDGVEIVRRTDVSLNHLMIEGEIDAILAPQPPPSFYDEDKTVVRLFPEDSDVEQQYFARTGIFPIMHTVVLRREIHDRHPWVAASLLEAFERARGAALTRLFDIEPLPVSLPFLHRHIHETRSLMGDNPWPYGFAANENVLRTACEYAYEQGLCARLVSPEELFSPFVVDPTVDIL